jgi:hypothetical protein
MRILARTAIFAFLLCVSLRLQSQDNSKPTRFEAGPQIAFVVHGGTGLVSNDFLVGGRFTFNARHWLGVESEWGFTPQNVVFNGGHINQFLFGPKVGIRKPRLGAFIKARGGFSSISNFTKTFDETSLTQTLGRQTNPLIDLGGVIEIYPGKRWLLRYDFSDLVTQHNNNTVFTFQSPLCASLPCTFQAPDTVTHSFYFSTGISYRF